MARSNACRVPEPRSRTIQRAPFGDRRRPRARFFANGWSRCAEDDERIVAPSRDVQVGVRELALDESDVDFEVRNLLRDLFGVRDFERDLGARVFAHETAP